MKGKERARLKKEAQSLDVTLELGKGGLSATIVTELKRQLKATPLVKVQIRKSAAAEDSTKSVAEALAAESNATLVEVRGSTAVYARAGKFE